jgi:hypothetical protein
MYSSRDFKNRFFPSRGNVLRQKFISWKSLFRIIHQRTALYFLTVVHYRNVGGLPFRTQDDAEQAWRWLPSSASLAPGAPDATLLLNDPEHWQQRADEVRAIAEQMNDMPSRKKLCSGLPL